MLNWTKEFEEFLIKNDCFSQFMDCLYEKKYTSLSKYVYQQQFSPMTFIVIAVHWRDWNEFWQGINRLWCEYVSNIEEHKYD